MKSTVLALALVLMLSACTSYGVIDNKPLLSPAPAQARAPDKSYGLNAWNYASASSKLFVTLAFSGGGTRAAALSYGVLKELRDTSVPIDGRHARLLDEVDTITSVSGGSFTAAYYGLHGDKIFTDFEGVFLRRNVEQSLIDIALSPLAWFSRTGRTERAIQFYEEHIFHHATFADMAKSNRPFIFINASDLGYGVRFSFIQEYFNLLCSDLSTYPVARAVAASSAVPVLFNPVVVENYAGCDIGADAWLQAAKKRAADDSQAMQIVNGLETLVDKDRRQYVHFVDGGITDNLGLRALVDVIAAAGGIDTYMAKLKLTPPQRMVLIVVNASTNPEPAMDKSNVQPSLMETVSAVSDIQLHRYNAATLDLMKHSLAEWAKAASTPQRPINSYFIEVSFRDLAEPNQRRFFQAVPTNFSLNDEQVDKLIAAGGELLRNNPEFRRMLADLGRQ